MLQRTLIESVFGVIGHGFRNFSQYGREGRARSKQSVCHSRSITHSSLGG